MTTGVAGSRESLLSKLHRLTAPRAPASNSVSAARPAPSSPGEITDSLMNHLNEELTNLGGEMRTVSSLADLPGTILQIAREARYKRIAMNDDPLLQESDLLDRLADFQDFKILLSERSRLGPDRIAEPLSQCQLGITGCDAVLADTATIVMSHRGWGGRAISLLPECHAVVARRAQIFPNLDAWFDSCDVDRPLPTCMTLITGPSRTADIEKVLVRGVHGPLRLVLILVP